MTSHTDKHATLSETIRAEVRDAYRAGGPEWWSLLLSFVGSGAAVVLVMLLLVLRCQ